MPSESPLPPGRLCFKFPMTSQNGTSSCVQTFKHMSPWGTFKFQSTDCDTGFHGTSLEALESSFSSLEDSLCCLLLGFHSYPGFNKHSMVSDSWVRFVQVRCWLVWEARPASLKQTICKDGTASLHPATPHGSSHYSMGSVPNSLVQAKHGTSFEQ